MRGEEFLEKMGWIDPAFVEAADIAPKKKIIWLKWAAIAACLCLVIAGGVALGRQNLPIIRDTASTASSDSESKAQPDISRPENEGVTIPKAEFSLAPSPTAMSIGFFYFEGRCYVQEFEPIRDGEDLIGEFLGTAIGRIDGWTPGDGYVDFAGSVWGNFYAVKGYDPSFMLCMRNPDGIIWPYICNNGITLNYGSELFEDRLHLSERFTAVQYVSSDSQSERYELNDAGDTVRNFIADLDAARFVFSDDVPLPEGVTYLGATELYGLDFLMEDGTTVSLRLYENEYVCLEQMWEVCLQVPEESYQALLHALDSRADSTAVEPPQILPTLEDCRNDPELGSYVPAYTPDHFTVESTGIDYRLDEETAKVLGMEKIRVVYTVPDYSRSYSVAVTWADRYEETGGADSIIDAADLSVETLSDYVEILIADMEDGSAIHTEVLAVAVRYGDVCVVISTYGVDVETVYEILRSIP